MTIKVDKERVFVPQGAYVKQKARQAKYLKEFFQSPLKATALNVLTTAMVCVCVWLFSGPYSMITENKDMSHWKGIMEEQASPMLLSYDLVEAQEAELRIILWFEKGKPLRDFRKALPQEGWVWKEVNNSISTGYSLAGYTVIERDSEKKVFAWYQSLAKDVAEAGGIAYLDERIREGIDIAHYAIRQNILPKQFSLTGGTASLVGFQDSSLPEVMAGGDPVNIQLISKGYGEGKTALAIPVLLEEF